MAIKIKSKPGFTRFEIDHTYHVWVCKIMITNWSSLPVIAGVNAEIADIPYKKGNRRCLVISYCTMNWSDHDRMQKEIALYLEQHAISKTKKKYAWAHEHEDFQMSEDFSLAI